MDALGLHFLLRFDPDGRQHPVPHMFTLGVTGYLDVAEHVLPCFLACSVGPAPYPLTLEEIEEAHRYGIVMAIVAPAPASKYPIEKFLHVQRT